jgi:hypothetical protein
MAGLWRWRRNPLCRGTDLAEAWAALLTALLIAMGVPAVGWAVGLSAHGVLEQSVREQRQQRHLVTATVLRPLSHPPLDPDPETSSSRDAHRRVLATWTAPDGTSRTGITGAPRAALPGERFRLWTDSRGWIVSRPMDDSTAAAHAVLAGLGSAAATLCLAEGARRLVVWQLMRRRYAQWDLAWQRADGGRAGAGS